MKKPTRLGTILLTFAVSFALLSVVRAAGNYPYTTFFSILPGQTAAQKFFWTSRTLRFDVTSPVQVNMKINDPSGNEIWRADDVMREVFNIKINQRGIYTVSVTNPTNTNISMLRIDATLYGFETDLQQASIILASASIILIASQRIYGQRHREKQQ